MDLLRPWLIRLLAWCLVSACAGSAQAGGLAVQDLAVLVDASGSETIASVSADAAAGRFRAAPAGLSAGYTRDVHWLRFTVRAPATGPWWLAVESAVLDDLRLFEPVDGGFVERHSGDLLPFAQREVATLAFVFKLDLPDMAPRTLYLRVQTRSSVRTQLALWQPEAFHAGHAREYAGLGVYLGLGGMLLLLNAVLWSALREPMYGWFSLHVGAHLLGYSCVTGVAGQFLWPDRPGWSDLGLSVGLALYLSSEVPVLQRLLQIGSQHPLIRLSMWVQAGLPWLLLPAHFTNRYAEAMNLVLIESYLLPCLALWVCWQRIREGSREAQWMIVAFSISLVGIAWQKLGVLGWWSLTPTTYVPALWAGAGTLLAVQLALFAHVRRMRADQRLAEQNALLAERDAALNRQARVEQAALVVEKDARLAEDQRAQDRLAAMVVALQQAQRLGKIGSWELDLASGAVVWSETMFNLFGRDPRQPAPQANDRSAIFTPSSCERLQAAIVHTLATGDAYVVELERVLPDGSIRWTESRGTVQRDEHGTIVGLRGTSQDISDRREAQAAEADRLSEQIARRSKDEFLARVSHEMRTPLNAVLGFSQLLALDEQVQASPVLTEQVDMIIGAARFVTTMIDDVLDLARIQSGGLHLAAEITELGAVGKECLAWLSPLAQRHQVVLRLRSHQGGYRVFGDRNRLRQVLINLVSNAIKYNHAGGSVDISIARLPPRPADADLPARGGLVEVAVRDTGSGLTPRQIAALFQPFNRLGAELSGIDGSGLGLAVARELVEAMQGQLLVASDPGQGAVFTLQLPDAGADPDVGEAAVDPPGGVAYPGGTTPIPVDPDDQVDRIEGAPVALDQALDRPFVVLYVEDNRLNAAVMHHAMKRLTGVQLETATDGEQGLARARQLLPDLVLLDMNLPRLSGTEVMQRLRDDPALAAIPCVAVSANAMPGDVDRALACGFSDYVIKPFTIDRLLDLVTSQIQRRAALPASAFEPAPGTPG